MPKRFSGGSEWRRWDLHVHTPETLKQDLYSGSTPEEKWDNFCKKINNNEEEIAVIGITDYLLIDNYRKFLSLQKAGKITRQFELVIPNIELRLSPVTASGKALNLHLLISPDFVPHIEERIYSKLTIKVGTTQYDATRPGLIRLGKSSSSNFSDDEAYKEGARKFIIDFDTLRSAFDDDQELKGHCLVVVSNSSNDGASGIIKHSDFFATTVSDLDIKRQAIYKFSDAIFSGNPKDREYFLGKGTDTKEKVIERCGSLKPCIHGSDAHTESKIFKPDEDRFCWIKADPTFNGLKQIIYEPDERVRISPIKPDQKDDFKVIRKIKFIESDDFPEEIELNSNLCSIIGSRSSGKSALLAYIAHSVDTELTENLVDGPGEGEEYYWSNIYQNYSVEWCNGQSNDESPGNVVYIPQNYLFEKSKDPDEIKKKIEPVLFKVFPDFEGKYKQAENAINSKNQEISDQVVTWFTLSDFIKSLEEQLKSFGLKKVVENEKKEIDSQIEKVKQVNQLSDGEVRQYQMVSEKISALTNEIDKINADILKINNVSEKQGFFERAKITLFPSLASLPTKIQDSIKEILESVESGFLGKANQQVVAYKVSVEKEKKEAEKQIKEIIEENDVLIKKYQNNLALEKLIKKSNEFVATLNRIGMTETEKNEAQAQLQECVRIIKSSIDQRKVCVDDLGVTMESTGQGALQGISFGVESGFDADLDFVSQNINIRNKSKYIAEGQLRIEEIRESPGEFLGAIYSGEQKLLAHTDKQEVARDVLLLTEKVRFTAKMEEDKIGGFSEPTMTPGKRALFALRLILAESEDTWPLLIDQPEDDLDSRSIYDEIVPFLKEKKKERQIIMVSHNANLVIGSDSDQIIVANRNGNDRKNKDGKQFNYLTGSLEHSKTKNKDCQDTLDAQGVCEHSCEILDGGKFAFENRKNKYHIK